MWRLGDSQAKRFSVFVSIEVIRKSTGANLGANMSIVPMILASRCFAESLYLTSPVPLPPDDDRFQFIAPYFPELNTRITVSISKGAWNKDLPAPTCTLACIAPAGTAVGFPTCTPSGLPTVTDGTFTCTPSGTPACSSNGTPAGDSTAGRPTCTSTNSGNYGPPVVTISASPVPVARGFLYFTKNALFSDAANVSISTDGLLSGADSSSTQQITAILTELAQTAAAVMEGAPFNAAPPTAQDDRRKCLETINKSASNLPFYRSHDIL
jgi:hypothetical protein